MTAEIAVMNSEAVALAADSAVTAQVGPIQKISRAANKIFGLSPHLPVGIMIYGSATFMGIPWETIIKVYRKVGLPQNGFGTLEEYARDFISFLSYGNIQIPEVSENQYVTGFAATLLSNIRQEILERVEDEISEEHDFYEVSTRLSEEVILEYNDNYRHQETVLPLTHSRTVMRRYRSDIEDYIAHIFGQFRLSDDSISILRQILVYAFARSFLNDIYTGAVVAGFGEKEFLPTVRSYKIEGIIRYKTKGESFELLKHEYDHDHSFVDEVSSVVIAFAQSEMVHRFMEGIDPSHLHAESSFLDGLFKDFVQKVVSELSGYNDAKKEIITQQLTAYAEQLIQNFFENMKMFRETYFSDPTIEAVARLPKTELATMAESLVHLTSLKRKISQEAETVAEPIDVALISKGDGLVWIKRKHYFEAERNPQFFMKRQKEFSNEGKDDAKD